MRSHLFKQLLGAALGMVVATIVYVAADQASFSNIKGYLISDPRIADSAGEVRVNRVSTYADDLALVARRAAVVGEQLQAEASTSEAPNTLLNQHARTRAETRSTDDLVAQAVPTVEVEAPGTQTIVEPYDRLKLRNARAVEALQNARTGAELYKPNLNVLSVEEASKGKGYKPFQAVTTPENALKGKGQSGFKPVQEVPAPNATPPAVVTKEVLVPDVPKTVVKEVTVPVPTPTRTIIREVKVPVPTPAKIVVKEVRVPVHEPRGKNLPDSGPLLNGLLLLSALLAFAKIRPDLSLRFFTAFRRSPSH